VSAREADVLVVGAGAGGVLAALALVEQGFSVALLETGPRFDPKRYETWSQRFEVEPNVFERVESAPLLRSYESAEGEPLDPRFAELASRSPTLFARPAREGARRAPFRWSRALGVGGSTLHYQGEAHRFPAHAFRMRTLRGVAEDWPIAYEDLAPFYDRVERLLGVAGDPTNPFKPPRGPYPYGAHPLSPASRKLAAGARKLGWQALANPVAILPSAAPGRAACHYCNGCLRGCPVGAKGSVDVAVLPLAEKSGRLRLVTGFHASRLEHRADGRVTGVLGFDAAGRGLRERARAVVLAAGAIETPRILLNSAGGAHPHGVGNAHGQVGLHLMETLYVLRYASFAENLETWAGIPLDHRIWDGNGAAGAGDVPNGIVLGALASLFEGPVGTALEAVPGFGIAHRERLARRFGATLALLAIAEQLPRQENRVTLAEARDRFGAPLARVEMRLDAADLAALALARRRLGALAEAAGVAELPGQVTAYDQPNASHVAGTCRMGADPERSVVDASGALHARPEVVVADASVLVTEGAGDSPSLTIQALALRAGEALAARMKRGEV
jgi:choline dehydrogenase-like flavoprotein